MAYADLRQYLKVLDQKGLIKWVDAPVDKDWEISAVARKVFERDPSERFALGFRKVIGFDIPVVLGVIGGSRKIYATALEIEPKVDKIIEKWSGAQSKPLETELVSSASCQEVILEGEEVNLFKFPIPTWTPGLDPAPYLTAPCMITKDLTTGIRNVGVYRMQVKSRNTTGVLWDLPSQHGAIHYAEYEKANTPMPVAVVLGADPTVLMAAVSKTPQGVDELAVAGGLRGEPVQVVKCRTIDVEVPATAEIVLEGEILPQEREIEGPFGEYTGYMGGPYKLPVFRVKCITHRKSPIYHALHSQKPPSESSLLRQIPEEANVYKHLVQQMRLPGIVDVHCPESGSSYAMLWIRMAVKYPGHAQQVLSAAWTHHPSFAKWVVVTDEDIDIRDPFSREWALSWRVEPQKDIFFIPNTSSILLDPSCAPPEVDLWARKSSKICIDATKKWEYPAIAYPPQENLEKVQSQWVKYGI